MAKAEPSAERIRAGGTRDISPRESILDRAPRSLAREGERPDKGTSAGRKRLPRECEKEGRGGGWGALALFLSGLLNLPLSAGPGI